MRKLTFLLFLFISVSTFCQDITTGLVAYYPFNCNANDASGNGNNGIVNGATLVADRFGNPNSAYSFNGSSSWIRVPNSASLQVGNHITLAAYVKVQGFYQGPCHSNTILDKGDNDNVPGWFPLRFDDGFYTVYTQCNPVAPNLTHENFYGNGGEPPVGTPSTTYITTNQWYCVVYTYDGTTAKVYIDGNMITSNVYPISTFNNPYDLYIGRKNDPTFPYWFTGVLDEIRYYNRALTAADVSALCGFVPSIITIQPTNVTVCSGSNAAFSVSTTAAATGHHWQLNTGSGWNNITNNSTYSGATTNILNITNVAVSMNGNQYRDSISTSCSFQISTAATLFVTTPVTPAVSISASANPICAGTSVTFTATPTNGGTSPSYQWQKNGINVGTNSGSYTDNALGNNDIIKVTLTTNLTCVTSTTALSNSITMTVNPIVTPTVSISGSANNICAGTSVTFTATITNGGTTPSFQWQKNGVNVGTNSSTYTDNGLTNGDIIKVILTSNAPCTTSPTATSSGITMTVNPLVTPAVSIVPSSGNICPGTPVTFTATPTNGGSAPAYQWTKNGVNVGTNSSSYTDNNIINGDIIKVTLTSNANCLTTASATSNSITMIVTTITGIRYPTVNAFNQPTQLQARILTNATTYLWSPATGLSNPGIINPTFTNPTQVEYTIRIGLGGNCQVVDTLLVTVFKKKDIYIPQGFSPNGDGKNDRLYPILVGITKLNYFRVYNRWGNLLFETTSSTASQGWDGTYKGKLQPVETYTWIAEGVDIDGKTIQRSGNTLLIR